MPVRRKEIGPESGPGDVGETRGGRAWRAWVWPAVHVLIDVVLAVVAIAAMDSFAYPDLGNIVGTDGLVAQGVWMVVLLRLLTEVCIGGVASQARPAGGRRAERARLAVSSLTIAVCVSVMQAGVPTMRAAWSEPGLAPVPPHGMAVAHARFGVPRQDGTIRADAALQAARAAVPSAATVGLVGEVEWTQGGRRHRTVGLMCPFDCPDGQTAAGVSVDPRAKVAWFPQPVDTPPNRPTGGVVVTDVATAKEVYRVGTAGAATLAAGGIVVRQAPTGGVPADGFVAQRVEVSGFGTPKQRVVRADTARSVSVTVDGGLGAGYPPPGVGDGGEVPLWSYPDAIVTPEGAQRLGVKYGMCRLVVMGGVDGISGEDEQRLAHAMSELGVMDTVTRRPLVSPNSSPVARGFPVFPALAAVALLLHGLLAGRRCAVSPGSAAVAAALGVAPVAGLALLASAPWSQVAAAALAPLLVGAGALAGTVWARRRA